MRGVGLKFVVSGINKSVCTFFLRRGGLTGIVGYSVSSGINKSVCTFSLRRGGLTGIVRYVVSSGMFLLLSLI